VEAGGRGGAVAGTVSDPAAASLGPGNRTMEAVESVPSGGSEAAPPGHFRDMTVALKTIMTFPAPIGHFAPFNV